jgi:hypothetical protein
MSAAGAVGIFKRNSDRISYSQVQFFQASDRQRNASFGYSLAINSNATYIVISSPNVDRSTAPVLTDCGSVYVYKKNLLSDFWNVLYQFRPSDNAAFDRFGYSLAMTPDAEYIVASSPFKAAQGINQAGQLYIYKKSPTTDFWNYLQQVNMISPVNIAQLGWTMQSTYDASYIFAGTEGTNGGISNDRMTVVFKKDLFTDYWSEATRICAVSSLSGMGQEFSISSNADYFLQIAAGTFSSFMFKKDVATDNWNLQQIITPSAGSEFINRVAVSSDGSNILYSYPDINTNSAGTVYLYKKQTTTDFWAYQDTLVPARQEAGAGFGRQTTFIADNSLALCAAPAQSSISGTIGNSVGFIWPFTLAESKIFPDSAQYVITTPPVSARLALYLPLASNASNNMVMYKTSPAFQFAESITFYRQGSDIIDTNYTSINSTAYDTSYQFVTDGVSNWYTLASYGESI